VSAKPPKMNILASSIQVWADVKIIDYVPKNNFRPVPKVDSAVIKLNPNNKPIPKNYYETIKLIFKHPRKTLLNNLYISKKIEKGELIEKLKEINIEPKIRPENLSITAIKKIALML
jgi:16S rRNA (adenine1518-N6/adenine1519-N6)-dimethyltransferase